MQYTYSCPLSVLQMTPVLGIGYTTLCMTVVPMPCCVYHTWYIYISYQTKKGDEWISTPWNLPSHDYKHFNLILHMTSLLQKEQSGIELHINWLICVCHIFPFVIGHMCFVNAVDMLA